MPFFSKDVSAWQDLELVSKQTAPFASCVSNEILSLDIYHQQLPSHALALFDQFLEQQQFWQALACFKKKQAFAGIFPHYMSLRNLDWQLSSVRKSLDEMATVSETIRQGRFLGCTGQAITDVVNIGMGGSDLGPKLCIDAFHAFKTTDIRCHFISNADEYGFEQSLEQLNPETTLFLISSKSFQTEETLINAQKALAWCGHPEALKTQFIALTAHKARAESMGYKHILNVEEWVTGRFSCCSAMNLITAIYLGFPGFLDFLEGAKLQDSAFLNTELHQNHAILLAILGVWNINFLNIPSHLLLLYDNRLKHFVDYVQQMDMESNAKLVDKQGNVIDYATAPIVWGGLGNEAHHSYFQLLLQGAHQVAIDFISCGYQDNLIHQLCESRKNVLRRGQKDLQVSKNSLLSQASVNHIILKEFSPKALGHLIALYENKIFTEAWLWNIHPFEQPGVEAVKKLYVKHE